MGFTIPNDPAAAVNAGTFTAQAQPDKVDIDIIAAGIGGTGVVSGCAVTASGSGLTANVASGTITVAGTSVSVSSGSGTPGAASGTYPRIDLVVVNNAGTISITAGTAASAPCAPNVPASSVCLAFLYIPANLTTLASTHITDKRVVQPPASGAFSLISSQTLSGSVVSVTFSSISASYTHLQLRFVARSDRVAQVIDQLRLRMNGDTGVNYSYELNESLGVAAPATTRSLGDSSIMLARLPAASSTASDYAVGTVDHYLYASTTPLKAVTYQAGKIDTSDDARSTVGLGQWANTAAVTSLTLFAQNGNLVSGSRFDLYGIS